MNYQKRIYLDHNATTPVDPRVMEAMLPYFTEKFGNAASRNHPFGWEAQEAVDAARRIIAAELNAESREIIFTSGATESINLAIKGLCEANEHRGHHIVTQITEHKAVLDTCKEMERRGWKVSYLPVNKDGRISQELVAEAIHKDTLLVAIMHANNEIGVLHPIAEIGSVCKEEKVFFLVDAAQSFGRLPIDVEEMGIDLLAASGHKIYGPKGIGFLYVRRKNPRLNVRIQIDGGGHERGMRSGTLPVPLIVGLGKAIEIYAAERDEENSRLRLLRDTLKNGILAALPGTVVNGSMEHRLANNLNMSFPNVDAEVLLVAMKDVACSTGSACTSATLEPSHVIRALGGGRHLAQSAVRFAVGRFNTEEEIEHTIEQIVTQVKRLRRWAHV